MKMRRLPEIDLARIAPLTTDEKYIALRRQKVANPPYSYDPLRGVLSDILDVEYPLTGRAAPTSWEKIDRKLVSLARKPEELKANRKLAEMLYHHAVAEGLKGRSEDFFPFPIGMTGKVRYWFRLSYIRKDRLVVPFLDPRKQNSLGPKGRRFAFSMMHQAIREADPDFEAASFEIVHFGRAMNGGRTMNVYSDDTVELFSFEELDAMVRETYEIWAVVLREREEEARKAAGSRRGPLGI